MNQVKVSIIIVSYNVQYFLTLCLDATLKAIENIEAEIIVVDNDSKDQSVAIVREQFPQVKLIENKDNVGFSKANNQGVAIAQGEYILYLNPDTVIPEDFFSKSLDYLDYHPHAAALGPRIIDGAGKYSYDAKKSFPGILPSLYKIIGLSKFFPNSPRFNAYYAAHIDEWETAKVDILSGCCLMVRKSAMDKAGGSFDESYFMYCEDFDLCQRLTLTGYENIYFPEVTIIHYKGESTKKMTYRYMKIFNEALAIFVRKYYPKTVGSIYIFLLKIFMVLRTLFNILSYAFSLIKLFVLDTLLLSIVLILVKNYWLDNVKDGVVEIDSTAFLQTSIGFLTVWLTTLFLSGAYDKPFSLFKAGRGMLLGTLIVLALYGLLPFEYRYSRGIILFSGIIGTAVILIARTVFASLKLLRLVPRGKNEYKAAVIAHESDYIQITEVLKKINYNLSVMGRIDQQSNERNFDYLGDINDLKYLQKSFRINELIFSSASFSYQKIIGLMEVCSPHAYYKIHMPDTSFIIGSSDPNQPSDIYLNIKKYNIELTYNKRNKRIIDLLSTSLLILGFPLFLCFSNGRKSLSSVFKIWFKKTSFIAYNTNMPELPKLKKGLFPPFETINGHNFDQATYYKLAEQYAKNYSSMEDIRLIIHYIFKRK